MQETTWNRVKFFHEGDDYYDSIISDLRRAKRSIQIETYIFDESPLTKMFLEELGQARTRRCEVQLVVDGFGSMGALSYIIRECQQRDIPVRIYKPLFRDFHWFVRLWTPNLMRFGAMVKNLHRRNHRKVVIIDTEIAYVGSFNFAAVHSARIVGKTAWRDTGVRLEGPEIPTLQNSFREVWASAEQGFIPPLKNLPSRLWRMYRPYLPTKSLFRINFQPLHRRWLYRDLLHRIRHAEKRIFLVTAYFLPRRSLLLALENAAKRNVAVEIILPSMTDVPIVKWAAMGVTERLSRMGVQVFEYQNRVLHAKYTVIDDWASVGSLNYNHRSFLHDLEVEAILNEPEYIASLIKQFEVDRANSVPWQSVVRGTNIFIRFFYRMAFRLRYLL